MFKREQEAKSINFLQPVNDESSALAGAISWVSTIGKRLLIVVEIVVLLAFFGRFIMDGRSNDLTEKINAQVVVLENDTWKQSSVRYDNLQTLLFDIKNIETGQKINSSVVSEIINNIPMTINLNNFSFNGTRVSLALTTPNFKALKDYEDSLKNNSYYSDVRFNINKSTDELEVNVSFLISEPKI
ncbi:MAG: hypothetical protein ACOX0X_01665 [Candidatus Dojkabacteria bacterium]